MGRHLVDERHGCRSEAEEADDRHECEQSGEEPEQHVEREGRGEHSAFVSQELADRSHQDVPPGGFQDWAEPFRLPRVACIRRGVRFDDTGLVG
ncbi:hypothetical protein ACFPRL_11940 [Pseudoclavibacter helvolus]